MRRICLTAARHVAGLVVNILGIVPFMARQTANANRWADLLNKENCVVDLKNVKVDFPPNSAYAVLLGLVLNCGIDSVMSALGEIAAQQGLTCPQCGASFSSGTTPKDGKTHCPQCGASW